MLERRLEEVLDDEAIISQIQDQYEKGKLISSIYHIDSFNINSSLYQDLCFSLELDGKDLVLEDRVKFLFPYYSLCEENCTYSHTDFDTERIYCNFLRKGNNMETKILLYLPKLNLSHPIQMKSINPDIKSSLC